MKSLNAIQAVVTGGASGVGRATVEALAAQGAQVRVVSRSADKLEKLKREVKWSIEIVQGDITDSAVVARSLGEIRTRPAGAQRGGGPDRCRIGVIGAGSMGGILARHLAKLGHHVSIANSRGPESLTALAAEIGATPVSVVDAAKAGEIVILAIPTKAVADLPRGLFANVPSSVVVIDIGNYHPELRDGRIDAIDRGMLDSQWVAQQIGRPVIKAFNNIFAKSLLEKGVPRGTKGRIALSVAGDSSDAKAAVLRLVDDLGFDPVDGGDLDNSWRQQPGTPAYCQDLEAAALRRALAEADRSRIAEYRAEQEARIRRYIAAQTPGGSARQ